MSYDEDNIILFYGIIEKLQQDAQDKIYKKLGEVKSLEKILRRKS